MKYPIRLSRRGRTFLAGILAVTCLHDPSVARSESSPGAPTDKRPPAEATTVAVQVGNDTQILRDILIAMMHDDVNDPVMFRPVKITVTQGVVTLKGRLKSEKLKAKLLSLVTTVVTPDNILDEIEVK